MAAPRVVLLGATGYTGRLTAQALVDRGLSPHLAARDETALSRLGGALKAESVVTDARRIGDHLKPGDVLVSCAGPFAQIGEVVLEAALASRAHLLDCAGEAGYLRSALLRHPEARAAGVTVLPGFGFDYVPGHLAAVAALRGAEATQVRVLYALAGAHGSSRGTRASLSAASGFVLRGGELVDEPRARWVEHTLSGRRCRAAVIGSTEALLLRRVEPRLQDIEVALGRMRNTVEPRPVREPLVEAGIPEDELGGPSAQRRARSASIVIARAGSVEARIDGPDGYELTAALLAASAEHLVEGAPPEGGVRGPVELFGADGLERLLAGAGMTLSILENGQ